MAVPRSPVPQPLDVFRLGRVPYAEALAVQRRLQGALVAARHDACPPAHALLVVEHDPVFTLGAGGDAANVLAGEAELAALGAALVRTDRGGDVTFHGPGQIVAYPVLDLNRLHAPDGTPAGTPLRDLHRYLRALEDAVVATCADAGVAAGRVAGRTGVWVGPDARGPERKVCAMGIRCSRWVTMHGLALNVTTDLAWFDRIVPCGIADRGVTSLAREAGAVDAAAAEAGLVRHLAWHVGAAPVVHADGPAALAARLARDEARRAVPAV